MPFTYRVREFDEAHEAAVVQYWSEHYLPDNPLPNQRVFADMRRDMASHQGEERSTSVQVLRLGNVALVGVPAELFASLGLAIRRRSPFRDTHVVGLANDTIGYVGDREGCSRRRTTRQSWPGRERSGAAWFQACSTSPAISA